MGHVCWAKMASKTSSRRCFGHCSLDVIDETLHANERTQPKGICSQTKCQRISISHCLLFEIVGSVLGPCPTLRSLVDDGTQEGIDYRQVVWRYFPLDHFCFLGSFDCQHSLPHGRIVRIL